MGRIGKAFVGAAAALVAASVSASAQYNSAYDNDMACRQYADQAVAPMRDQANAQTAGSALVGAGLGAALGAAVGGGSGAAIGAGSGASSAPEPVSPMRRMPVLTSSSSTTPITISACSSAAVRRRVTQRRSRVTVRRPVTIADQACGRTGAKSGSPACQRPAKEPSKKSVGTKKPRLGERLFDDLVEEPLEQALALRPDLPHIAFDGIDRAVMADRLSGLQAAVQRPQPRGQTLQLVPIEGAGYFVLAGSSAHPREQPGQLHLKFSASSMPALAPVTR
jgi:hypothetical protein